MPAFAFFFLVLFCFESSFAQNKQKTVAQEDRRFLLQSIKDPDVAHNFPLKEDPRTIVVCFIDHSCSGCATLISAVDSALKLFPENGAPLFVPVVADLSWSGALELLKEKEPWRAKLFHDPGRRMAKKFGFNNSPLCLHLGTQLEKLRDCTSSSKAMDFVKQIRASATTTK